MRKSKCPVCVSPHTIKNGSRKGVQLYKCMDCGHQFRTSRIPSDDELWRLYQERKQTVGELAEEFRASASTIKRRLRNVSREWVQPPLSGSGFIHIDATYWGVLLAIDEERGYPLYMSFIRNETVAGKSAWYDTLHKRSTLKSGKTQFTHRCLRSAMHSIDFYLPYLFTHQREDCRGMPNTNNKIEGTFTDLKRKLNNHSGMSRENRKRFICGFFLALKDALSMEKERMV